MDIPTKKNKISLKENLIIIRWSIQTTYKISPSLSIMLFISSILLNIEQLLNAYLFAKVIDNLITVANNSTTFRTEQIIPIIIAVIIYNLIVNLIGQLNTYSIQQIADESVWRIPQLLYLKINNLGIQSLEEPDIVNLIQRAKETTQRVIEYSQNVFVFIAITLKVVLSGIIAISISPLLTAILIFALLPGLILDARYLKKIWAVFLNTTEERRKVNSSLALLSDANALHEIRIIAAFNYLHEHYDNFINNYLNISKRIRQKWRIYDYLSDSVLEVILAFGYLTIINSLISKVITVGTATFQIRSLISFRQSLGSFGSRIAYLQESGTRIKELKDVFYLNSSFKDGIINIPKLKKAPLIEIRNISFKYPNSDKYSIEGLSLQIKPGEKIAIVGENGAGKTTLVKLLCRIYQVEKGEILINGENINNLKIEDWYKNIGVLFQEYNKYDHLSVRENIAMGNTKKKQNLDEIKIAAREASADEFIENYNEKYEQVLSEKYRGGTRPSTGQWQKLAIARFFYRNAPLIIFDEPTAAIDAVSESNIFKEVYNFFKGKSVIIISHRFSTVRQADKIYVLNQGKIIEHGTHNELLKLNGKYSYAFNTQAKGYK